MATAIRKVLIYTLTCGIVMTVEKHKISKLKIIIYFNTIKIMYQINIVA